MMTGTHNLTLKSGGRRDAYMEQSYQKYKQLLKVNNNLEIKSTAHMFRDIGYQVWGGGKLFHGGINKKVPELPLERDFDEHAWDQYLELFWDEISPDYRFGNTGNSIANIQNGYAPAYKDNRTVPDRYLAMWATNKILNARYNQTPYFLGVGFYRPHLKWFVPQKYFDLYPLDKIIVPDTTVGSRGCSRPSRLCEKEFSFSFCKRDSRSHSNHQNK